MINRELAEMSKKNEQRPNTKQEQTDHKKKLANLTNQEQEEEEEYNQDFIPDESSSDPAQDAIDIMMNPLAKGGYKEAVLNNLKSN